MSRGDEDAETGAAQDACPSGMELALFRAGDLNDLRKARLQHHVARCLVCRHWVEQLEAAEMELLAPTGGPGVTTAAHRVANEVGRRRRIGRLMVLSLPASAVAASLILVSVGALKGGGLTPKAALTTGGLSASTSEPALGELKRGSSGRAKGSSAATQFAASLFVKHDKTVLSADASAFFQAGDQLRFAYSAPRDGYLAVFGVDKDGHISPFYPEDSLASLRVHAGQQMLLPDAIQLDDQTGDQRVYAVFRDNPWSDQSLREALRLGRLPPLEDVQALALPGASQTSWLLRRR